MALLPVRSSQMWCPGPLTAHVNPMGGSVGRRPHRHLKGPAAHKRAGTTTCRDPLTRDDPPHPGPGLVSACDASHNYPVATRMQLRSVMRFPDEDAYDEAGAITRHLVQDHLPTHPRSTTVDGDNQHHLRARRPPHSGRIMGLPRQRQGHWLSFWRLRQRRSSGLESMQRC